MTTTHPESATPRPAGGRGGRSTRFVKESVSELRKVLWPSRNELVTYSVVVIVFIAVLVAFIAGLDVAFTKAVLQVFG